jgi:hypothetical protein
VVSRLTLHSRICVTVCVCVCIRRHHEVRCERQRDVPTTVVCQRVAG